MTGQRPQMEDKRRHDIKTNRFSLEEMSPGPVEMLSLPTFISLKCFPMTTTLIVRQPSDNDTGLH
jgi:hypothetical protein